MATFSKDNGRNWSKPVTIVDHPQDDSPYGLLRCRDGSLTCFLSVQAPWYGFQTAPPEMKNLLDGLNTQQFFMRSTDNGTTWTRPTALNSPCSFYQRSPASPISPTDWSIPWPTYFPAGRPRGLRLRRRGPGGGRRPGGPGRRRWSGRRSRYRLSPVGPWWRVSHGATQSPMPQSQPIGRPSGRSRVNPQAVRSPSACRDRPTRRSLCGRGSPTSPPATGHAATGTRGTTCPWRRRPRGGPRGRRPGPG